MSFFGTAQERWKSVLSSRAREVMTASSIGMGFGFAGAVADGVALTALRGFPPSPQVPVPSWGPIILGISATVIVLSGTFYAAARDALQDEKSKSWADDSMLRLRHAPGLEPLSNAQASMIEEFLARQFREQARSSNRLWWASLALSFVAGFIVNWTSTPVLAWLAKVFSA